MNPIPSLPTDNLYKFCSVAGCLAIIIAGLTMFQAWRDILEKQWSIENRASEQRSRELDIKIGEALSQPWWIPDEGDTPEAAASRKKLKDEAERIKPIYEEAERKLGVDREKLESTKYDFKIIATAAGTLALIGFLIASYGLWNWRAIQLKQDQLLKLELIQQEARVQQQSNPSETAV